MRITRAGVGLSCVNSPFMTADVKKFSFEKYHGAGNDFIMLSGFLQALPEALLETPQGWAQIAAWCRRRFGVGADGLIALLPTEKRTPEGASLDFEMRYFNADGRPGSLCGNGGRCALRFAQDCGLIQDSARFLASDGPHHGYLQDDIVHLEFGHPTGVEPLPALGGWFADTGSPHLVLLQGHAPEGGSAAFRQALEQAPVAQLGAKLRAHPSFAPGGTNVNFVAETQPGRLAIRTFERGVEAETWACGTGAVAAALVYWQEFATESSHKPVVLRARGGRLQVYRKRGALWLAGPARKVFSGTLTYEASPAG